MPFIKVTKTAPNWWAARCTKHGFITQTHSWEATMGWALYHCGVHAVNYRGRHHDGSMAYRDYL